MLLPLYSYSSTSDDYPFKPVEIYARHPIYHPNIDIHTGKVAYLPVDWTPVLKLNFIALAVQMMMVFTHSLTHLFIIAYSQSITYLLILVVTTVNR